MKVLPIVFTVVGLALFGSAWLIPTDPTGRLSLLVTGGLMTLLAYTLSLERVFREEVRLLYREIEYLHGQIAHLHKKDALLGSRDDAAYAKAERLAYTLAQHDRRIAHIEENLSSTDKG